MIRRVSVSDSNVSVFYALKENQLFRINEPDEGIFIAESPSVIKRAISAGYEPVSFLIEEEQLTPDIERLVNAYDVLAYVCKYEELKTLVGYHMTRGFLCAFKRKPNPPLEDVCAGKKRIVVLENIMNPTNTGAIIRSGAALGIEAVLLSGGCADPLQRRASRVSMGNVFAIPWAYMDGYLTDVKRLRDLGFKVVAMALCDEAVYINEADVSLNERVAIVMGTEGDGIADETLRQCDAIVKIPMSNGVDSLNVAAASAVAFWELCKINKKNQ